MAKRTRRYCALKCFCRIFLTAMLIVLWIGAMLLSFHSNQLDSVSPFPQPSLPKMLFNATKKALLAQNPLQYIPTKTVNVWRLRNFTVVFGIPSEDTEGRRRRRYLQRTTCWQYDGVAAQKNKYSGAMLVLYVIGRHPSQQYEYSTELIKEAQQWSDIIALNMNEGKGTTNKKIGDDGKWGFEAEVGMSRKSFFWFDLALRTFPLARYIAKGDDDMFIRVPQYLADFALLPPRGAYWGFINSYERSPFDKTVKFLYAYGWTYTLERSVAEAFTSYTPLRNLVVSPFNALKEKKYYSFSLHAEDTMVGLAIKLSGYEGVVYVGERQCRFDDLKKNHIDVKLSADSVVLHHTTEKHYELLMKWFANVTVSATTIHPQEEKNVFYFACPNE